MGLYAKMKGPVGYTVIGSPTITDGVISGFTNTSYIKTDNALPSTNSLKFVVSFNTGTIATDRNQWLVATQSTSERSICWGIAGLPSGQAKRMRIYLSSNGTSWDIAQQITGTFTFSDNTDYLAMLVFDGNSYVVSISSDGGATWVQDITVNSSTQLSSQVLIFGNNESQSAFFPGTIDLKGTYIRVNEQLWFGYDFDRVKIRTAPYVRYTVVGNPTITDGVASNLSNRTNYFQLTQQPPSVINSFEFVCRCNSGSAARGTFAYSYPTGYYKYGGFYCRTATRESSSTPPFWRYKAQQTSSEESHSLTCPANSGLANSSNDLVYSKLTMETVGENDYLYSFSQSLDGITWTLLASKHDTYRMSGDDIGLITMTWNPNDTTGNTLYYARSIDLNNTYIKVNGQYWWHGAMSDNWQLYTGMKGPVGYTVVGSPTITDGVVSGFSSSNYLAINQQLDTSKPFEVQAKFNITSLSSVNQSIVGIPTYSGLFQVWVNRYSKISFSISTAAGSWNIADMTGRTLSVNTDYIVKAVFTGTAYELYLSLDNGITWTLENSTSSTALVNNGTPINLQIGNSHRDNWYVRGSIDLNNTYIKSNSQLWFGKDFIRIS